MKIINIGILAHVDAGKTTLTESLLYTSGAILELGSVDKGTTRTDTMFLERQRGITIQAAVTSFNWNDYKINIVDTPGHTDFITEVYRSLSVLDGAILVISAKDGVQAQTRILFHALQKMNIPTIIFINKIDQYGINLNNIYQNIKEKLSNDIIVMQNVTLTPEISIKNIIDLDDWDPVISKNDKLLEKYIVGEKLTIQELTYEESRYVKKGSLFPIYHGSARNNIGTQQLIEAISNLFCSEMNENDSELCGRVFKIEYTDHKQRLVYLRLYSGTLHLRDTIILPSKKKVKLTEIYIPSNGEMIQTKIVCSGDIFIIPNNTLRLNDIIGNEKILPCNVWNDKTVPILRTRIEPIKIEEREKLLDALTEIADTDPLLRYYVDTITHEIVISFLGTVQLEVICSLLIEKYHINIRIEDPTVIYLEKPLQKADYTIHIEVPPNPFWASIGLSITPLPIGSGIQYESKVSLGYLNQSFQNAVREGINYGLEQGLYGWKVTDCKICFEYGVYYSPVSTPSDFRFLAPIVLEQTLKKAGTQLLEPYCSFILFTPQGYFSRAYNDAQKHCAIIETSQSKNDEVIFTGHIPVRCINEYRNTLTLYTNGQAVFLTELKDYQIATCEPVIQSRRPNNRIDKVRHMFNKKEN
ncbi:tetracycline resistance ribosomal protection protein Tet(44) [Intestinibacter bartlettii]|uniref:Tetracycline resistance ribosomal protection protein Tet(44) n=1 Tax=Intestinibacter bartlettii TaxID=261299 RepID=A0ABS6E0M9_9FIRM|nr:tetracycline resistance ribosomal protection protein Tet(44) [Intestinibacter bartlettii]MBU5337550.1 tetracycline resistance ribosomal protection protein Tet(44) [Intestinibacter bartlettii]